MAFTPNSEGIRSDIHHFNPTVLTLTSLLCAFSILCKLIAICRSFSRKSNQMLSQNRPITNSISQNKYAVIVHDTRKGSVCLKNLPADTKVPFYGIIGSVSLVKKLSTEDLYVECVSKNQQEKLLATSDLAGISVECYEPYPVTNGIVYGLGNIHALKKHPDVVKYSPISDKTTQVIFATQTLPKSIKVDDQVYPVKPFITRIKRCTKCQKLNDHTLHHCKSTKYVCSKCSLQHPRSRCKEQRFKCANCKGNHSSAYSKCPRQEELRKYFKHRSMYFDVNEIDTDCYILQSTNEPDGVTSDLDLNNNHDTIFRSNSTTSITSSVIEDNTVEEHKCPSSGDPDIDHNRCPSFVQFILSTVLPILNMSPYIRRESQLAKIYKTTYQIDEDWDVPESDKQSAASILGGGKNSSAPSIMSPTARPTTNTDDRHLTLKSEKSKPLKKLEIEIENINNDIENIIIGDSLIRNLDEDQSDSKTFVVGVSGLSIDDCQEWLHSTRHMNSIKKVIMHVGINSCKSKAIVKTQWVNFLKMIIAIFPNSEIIYSAMIPARGRRQKLCNDSNFTLHEACNQLNITYIDHTVTFMPKGQFRSSLYRRKDEIHLSSKGTALLSDKLFSYLR